MSAASFAIRPFSEADFGAGLELCRLAGWNQLAADWRCLRQAAPDGLFAAEVDGHVAGTASAVLYPPDLGWVGMVLVHPDYRGRGLATRLMGQCIDHLRARGARSIKLDATEAGRAVYRKLGFRDERPVHRWMRPATPGVRAAEVPAGSALFPAPLREVDRRIFGADRSVLLDSLAASGVLLTGGQSEPVYGLVRQGYHAAYVGPMVCAVGGSGAARDLLGALLRQTGGGAVLADVFPEDGETCGLFREAGFAEQRRLTRMVLGDDGGGWGPGVRCAAGFEFG